MFWRVKWEIEVDAEDATEAARLAHIIMRDQDSTATLFEVKSWVGDAWTTVDIGGTIDEEDQ